MDERQPEAVHHAARRVWALHDSRTIVIMDALSLQEITWCSVAPRHGEAQHGSVTVANLAGEVSVRLHDIRNPAQLNGDGIPGDIGYRALISRVYVA